MIASIIKFDLYEQVLYEVRQEQIREYICCLSFVCSHSLELSIVAIQMAIDTVRNIMLRSCGKQSTD
jgi:hypothetical protein